MKSSAPSELDLDTSSFGRAITSARRHVGMSQKELAGRILKEDGLPITPQYLNDIEHDRRSPSSALIVKQLASVFDINPDVLYWLAGRVPDDIQKPGISSKQIESAFLAFRKEIRGR